MAWDIGASGTFSAVADDKTGAQVKVPIAYAVDDTSVLGLTDNGDGTASVVALAAGSANLVATATNPDGTTVPSSPFAITVNPAAPADAASVTITETSGPDVTPAPVAGGTTVTPGLAASVAPAADTSGDSGPIPTPASADSLPNNG